MPSAFRVLAATLQAVVLLALLPVNVSAQSSSPGACTQPSAPPHTINRAAPEMSALAEQQGIHGFVSVLVTLDAQGGVTDAAIDQSRSPLFNREALQAARRSTYAPEVVNCVPVGGTYVTLTQFGDAPPSQTPVPYFSAYFIGLWRCTAETHGPIVRVYTPHYIDKAEGSADFFSMHVVRALSPGASATDGIDEEHYVRYRDHTTRARLTDPTGFPFDGEASAFANNTFAIEATSAAPHPVLRRLTYALADSAHFTRRFEAQATAGAPALTLSNEACARATLLH
jgi:TonB family protein